ncbi:hypothetical protein DMC30DRAFT_407357 [Rhodotorula diobovata]|uniref:Uncharacterized protein n=1 Tax=Rhodotorula diobovata TaxID=5288 RepID=A0A5C5FKM5_9BASI|nr:hypothetical protein DMC30DRAFT_407357 [Rhodotorula diobovata]
MLERGGLVRGGQPEDQLVGRLGAAAKDEPVQLWEGRKVGEERVLVETPHTELEVLKAGEAREGAREGKGGSRGPRKDIAMRRVVSRRIGLERRRGLDDELPHGEDDIGLALGQEAELPMADSVARHTAEEEVALERVQAAADRAARHGGPISKGQVEHLADELVWQAQERRTLGRIRWRWRVGGGAAGDEGLQGRGPSARSDTVVRAGRARAG